jgi:hypothetical protein
MCFFFASLPPFVLAPTPKSGCGLVICKMARTNDKSVQRVVKFFRIPAYITLVNSRVIYYVRIKMVRIDLLAFLITPTEWFCLKFFEDSYFFYISAIEFKRTSSFVRCITVIVDINITLRYNSK